MPKEVRHWCSRCERYVKEEEIRKFPNLGMIHNIPQCMSGRIKPVMVEEGTPW